MGIITKYGGGVGYFIRIEGDDLKIVKNNWATTTSIASLLDNNWHSVAIDFNFISEEISVFYDGL